MTNISRTELCKWLRDNSSGIYRHAADAADEIEMLAQLANQHFERAMENGNEVRRLREENELKNRLFADAVSALAAIDAALGMPEDGCNSTDKTITAIKLMHAVRVDDEKEITRLTEENERQRFDILAMNQSLDLMREESERLRKDAYRYRWFRVNENWRDSGPFDEFYEADLDAAIDVARGAK